MVTNWLSDVVQGALKEQAQLITLAALSQQQIQNQEFPQQRRVNNHRQKDPGKKFRRSNSNPINISNSLSQLSKKAQNLPPPPLEDDIEIISETIVNKPNNTSTTVNKPNNNI
eukprot:UN30393